MKSSEKIRFIAYCGVFCAAGVLFPMIFHAFGAVSGQTFLPMHIPVLIAGLAISPLCGLITGIVSPFISSILTNMPALVKMPFMCIELAVYGVCAGFLLKALSGRIRNRALMIYLSLIGAQIAGRLANLLCTFVAVHILGITAPGLGVKLALLSIPAGLIGIIIQWIIVPPCAVAISHIRGKQKPLS